MITQLDCSLSENSFIRMQSEDGGQNRFKSPYVREMTDTAGTLWWDYVAHNCFYCFKEK